MPENMRESILAFADRHLQPYTLRGDELIPDYCPICHGGDNRDRYTFALNLMEGIYVCKWKLPASPFRSCFPPGLRRRNGSLNPI